jgi:hypothetical protein
VLGLGLGRTSPASVRVLPPVLAASLLPVGPRGAATDADCISALVDDCCLLFILARVLAAFPRLNLDKPKEIPYARTQATGCIIKQAWVVPQVQWQVAGLVSIRTGRGLEDISTPYTHVKDSAALFGA